MKYYAYDSNSDLHHLGEHKSPYFARQNAQEIFGEYSFKSTVVLSETQIMTSAVTARMLSNVTPHETLTGVDKWI